MEDWINVSICDVSFNFCQAFLPEKDEAFLLNHYFLVEDASTFYISAEVLKLDFKLYFSRPNWDYLSHQNV